MRGKFASMVVALALSFLLWLSLAGQDTSTLDLTVPLELVNLPADLRINTIPTSVIVQVSANTAQGRFLAERKPHLFINVSAAKIGRNTFPISADSLELPRGVQVRQVSPPVLEFTAIKITNKIVPLRYTVSGSVAPAFRVHSVVTEPDVVTVEGPQELLDQVESIPTTAIDLEGLTSDTQLTVAPDITSLDPKLLVSPNKIRIAIHLEEVLRTETFAALPIVPDVENLPEGWQIELTPPSANVAVSWPASQSKEISPEDLLVEVSIDADELFSDGSPGEPLSLPVIVELPPNVTMTAVSPVTTTVTIKKIDDVPISSRRQASPSGKAIVPNSSETRAMPPANLGE